jgi:aminopeptidase-like protein
LSAIAILEGNHTYLNQNPKCEPQLGKRGLYSSFGDATDRKQREMAMLWVLNYSDGKNSLLDICEKSLLPFARVREAAVALEEHGLLKEASAGD